MKFINNKEPIKIRIGNKDKCIWKTIKHGEIVELEKAIGLRNGFEEITITDESKEVKVTEGKINNQSVETKQIEYTREDFFKELKSINGIGKKTAEDIVDWGPKEKLIEEIKKNNKLPFDDDIEKKLRGHYGRPIN